MDEMMRSLVRQLRALPSEEAADRLMADYPAGSPDSGKAYAILPHLSWKKQDQARLAREYLRRIPFASARPYEVFLSILPLRKFLTILSEFVPAHADERKLLLYHLEPLLARRKTSDADRQAISDFIERLATE